jgi:hypothetical protein
MLLHAAISLSALPTIHLVRMHGGAGEAAQVHDAGDLSVGNLHQSTCQGCTLVRAPGAPTAAIGRIAVREAVVRYRPAGTSAVPAPLPGPPLGGRAPPLV